MCRPCCCVCLRGGSVSALCRGQVSLWATHRPSCRHPLSLALATRRATHWTRSTNLQCGGPTRMWSQRLLIGPRVVSTGPMARGEFCKPTLHVPRWRRARPRASFVTRVNLPVRTLGRLRIQSRRDDVPLYLGRLSSPRLVRSYRTRLSVKKGDAVRRAIDQTEMGRARRPASTQRGADPQRLVVDARIRSISPDVGVYH